MKTFFVVVFLSLSSHVLVAQQEQIVPVTASDYCNFLNEVPSETNSDQFYNQTMGSDPLKACIARVGTPERYEYFVIAGREKNPVSFTTAQDQVSYCNWNGDGLPSSISSNDPWLPSNALPFFLTISSSGLAFSSGASTSGCLFAISPVHAIQIALGVVALIIGADETLGTRLISTRMDWQKEGGNGSVDAVGTTFGKAALSKNQCNEIKKTSELRASLIEEFSKINTTREAFIREKMRSDAYRNHVAAPALADPFRSELENFDNTIREVIEGVSRLIKITKQNLGIAVDQPFDVFDVPIQNVTKLVNQLQQDFNDTGNLMSELKKRIQANETLKNQPDKESEALCAAIEETKKKLEAIDDQAKGIQGQTTTRKKDSQVTNKEKLPNQKEALSKQLKEQQHTLVARGNIVRSQNAMKENESLESLNSLLASSHRALQVLQEKWVALHQAEKNYLAIFSSEGANRLSTCVRASAAKELLDSWEAIENSQRDYLKRLAYSTKEVLETTKNVRGYDGFYRLREDSRLSDGETKQPYSENPSLAPGSQYPKFGGAGVGGGKRKIFRGTSDQSFGELMTVMHSQGTG